MGAHAVQQRPRLLVLNQYYWPGVEATANLLTELCEALAEEYDVTMITGSARESLPHREVRNGVLDHPRALHLVRPHAAVAKGRELPHVSPRRDPRRRSQPGGPTL